MQTTINVLKSLIAHEEEMLRSWTNGDTSLMPNVWTLSKQSAYLEDLKNALEILTKTNHA